MTGLTPSSVRCLPSLMQTCCSCGIQALSQRENPTKHSKQQEEKQQTGKQYANEYWPQLSDSIQSAAVSDNTRWMHEGISKAKGPTQSTTAPLKSTGGKVITDKCKQMDSQVQDYSELYSRQNTVATSALDAIEPMPIMEELDAEPTIAKLSKATHSLASGKAHVNDGISPDLIKHCRDTLLQSFHSVLCQCSREGPVPQDMRDTRIVTLYRNTSERSKFNNDRGILLWSIVGKLYAHVLLVCLQKLAKRVCPESQCGFGAEWYPPSINFRRNVEDNTIPST